MKTSENQEQEKESKEFVKIMRNSEAIQGEENERQEGVERKVVFSEGKTMGVENEDQKSGEEGQDLVKESKQKEQKEPIEIDPNSQNDQKEEHHLQNENIISELNENYESIADRMLMQLEMEYLEVRKYDKVFEEQNMNKYHQGFNYVEENTKECNENYEHTKEHNEHNENGEKNTKIIEKEEEKKSEKEDSDFDENDEIPEGYQTLGNNEEPSSSEFSDEEENEFKSPSNETQAAPHKQNEEESQEEPSKEQSGEIGNNEIEEISKMEMIEVGPVPSSTFEVESGSHVQLPEDETLNNKIKEFALGIEIEVPEWAKNADTLEKRIKELFGGQIEKGDKGKM